MIKNVFLFLLLSVLAVSCDNSNQSPYPNTGNFYSTDDGESVLVADPIIYDVVVKNPDPNDEWVEFCLENTDVDAIQNVIFTAVLQERLTPYHYRLDSIIPLDSVKAFIERNKEFQFAKLQFGEQWYFNETTLEMNKKVNYITFGYELFNSDGVMYEYRPGFKVYLDKEHNQITK